MDLDLGRESIGSVAFGAGPHFCAGRWLANLELKVTLQEWLARIPEFEVAPDSRIRFSGGLLGSVNALPLVW
jgi:cytochrome P450